MAVMLQGIMSQGSTVLTPLIRHLCPQETCSSYGMALAREYAIETASANRLFNSQSS